MKNRHTYLPPRVSFLLDDDDGGFGSVVGGSMSVEDETPLPDDALAEQAHADVTSDETKPEDTLPGGADKPDGSSPADKQTDAPKEPEGKKPEGEKPEGEKPKETGDEDIDGIEPRPGSRPEIKNDFQRLKAIAKEERRIRRELEQKIAEQSASPVPEEVRSEIETLRKRLAEHDVRNDPTITEPFDKSLKSGDETLKTFMVEKGLPDAMVKKIFEPGADGSTGLDSLPAEWWERNFFNNTKIPSVLRTQLAVMLADRERLKDEREKAIASAVQNHDQIIKQRQEGEKKHWQEWGEKVRASVEPFLAKYEWARAIEVTDAMSAEQKKAAKEHNAFLESAQKEFEDKVSLLVARDPKTVAESVMATFAVSRLEKELAETKAKLEEAEDRIAKMRGQRRVTHTPTGERVATASKASLEEDTDAEAAFRAFEAQRS